MSLIILLNVNQKMSWKTGTFFKGLNDLLGPFIFTIIVRIEFSPVAEIGVCKGHYFPQETKQQVL